jgi:hypothetical protein
MRQQLSVSVDILVKKTTACKNTAIRIKPVVRVCWGGQEPAEMDNSTQTLNSRGGIIADRLVYISLIV